VGPGLDAGVIDLGDGLACVFKIESHSHPSAIEPVQGAATGVGGSLRDIMAMGARPIALMDPLRFGSLDDARTRYLFEGVVSGISGYGNSVGVPTVGGEVVFDDTYRDNPLVNVLCLGLARHGALVCGGALGGPARTARERREEQGYDGQGGAAGQDATTRGWRPGGYPQLVAGDTFRFRCQSVTASLAEECGSRRGKPVFTCSAKVGSLRCTNRAGRGFAVGPSSYETF